MPPITFTQEDAAGLHYPHCNALMVRDVIARNRLKFMLLDNRGSVNILFEATYDKMLVDHELSSITFPLYGFIRDSVTPPS